MEVVANGHNAGVEAGDVQGGEKIPVGAVPNLSVGDKGQNGVNPPLVGVHRHYLLAQIVELPCHMLAEAAQSNE